MRILATLLLLNLFLAAPVMADEATLNENWKDVPRPKIQKGLVVEPRLCALGSRAHLFWSGTNAEIRRPELFHASISDGDDELGDPRAPFFGKALSRVRKLAVGNARNMMGVLFQRQMSQSSDAYELLITMSADHGWGWSRPYVIDSFVYGKSGGSWVSIDGRQGTNRPEFCAAWVAENGQVKVATINITSSNRPRSQGVGTHAPGAEKVEVASIGKGGFVSVWSEGGGLNCSKVKPLVGGAEDAFPAIKGQFGTFFALAGSHRGPATLVAGSGGKLHTLTHDDKKWKQIDLDSPSLPSGEIEARSDLDDDKKTHLVVFTGDTDGRLLYTHQQEGKWSEPEEVFQLEKNLPCGGFDICATDDYVYVVASQGVRLYLARRKRDKD